MTYESSVGIIKSKKENDEEGLFETRNGCD